MGILWLVLVDLRKGACVILLVVDDPETIDRRGSIARKKLFGGIIVFQCKSFTQRGLDQGCPNICAQDWSGLSVCIWRDSVKKRPDSRHAMIRGFTNPEPAFSACPFDLATDIRLLQSRIGTIASCKESRWPGKIIGLRRNSILRTACLHRLSCSCPPFSRA